MLTTLENRFCVLFPNAKLQTSPRLTMDLKVRCSGLFYIVLNCSALFCFVLIRLRQNTKKAPELLILMLIASLYLKRLSVTVVFSKSILVVSPILRHAHPY